MRDELSGFSCTAQSGVVVILPAMVRPRERAPNPGAGRRDRPAAGIGRQARLKTASDWLDCYVRLREVLMI